MKKKTSVYLDLEVDRRLDRLARMQGISKAEAIPARPGACGAARGTAEDLRDRDRDRPG
jgi:hypothetical protein